MLCENLPKMEADDDGVTRIVSENLGSGLVIEDDADWSVYLKDQLEHMAEGSRYIFPGNSTNSDSPYGDDWDMLWVGHCGSSFGEDPRRYIIENDPTVPPPHHRLVNNAPDLAAEGFDNSTRVIYMAGGGLCTQSYALSLRGARKVLQYYTTTLNFTPIDLSLHGLCNQRVLDFNCVAPFPQLWGSHRMAGYTNRDSDIMRLGKGTIRETATTGNIVHPMRLNAKNILVHGLEGVESQWDDMPTLTGELSVRKG